MGEVMQGVTIRHGVLEDVSGRAAVADGWSFVPAAVSLDGDLEAEQPLSDHLGDHPPPILRPWVPENLDAHWVRARLPVVFAYTPPSAEVEKALLDEGFLAVRDEAGQMLGYPFRCSDHYGRTALAFGEGVPESVRRAIAVSFWELLLREADRLADFEERVFHPGACVWLHFSCADGVLDVTESEE